MSRSLRGDMARTDVARERGRSRILVVARVWAEERTTTHGTDRRRGSDVQRGRPIVSTGNFIAFPMSEHGAVGHFGGAGVDHGELLWRCGWRCRWHLAGFIGASIARTRTSWSRGHSASSRSASGPCGIDAINGFDRWLYPRSTAGQGRWSGRAGSPGAEPAAPGSAMSRIARDERRCGGEGKLDGRGPARVPDCGRRTRVTNRTATQRRGRVWAIPS